LKYTDFSIPNVIGVLEGGGKPRPFPNAIGIRQMQEIQEIIYQNQLVPSFNENLESGSQM